MVRTKEFLRKVLLSPEFAAARCRAPKTSDALMGYCSALEDLKEMRPSVPTSMHLRIEANIPREVCLMVNEVVHGSRESVHGDSCASGSERTSRVRQGG